MRKGLLSVLLALEIVMCVIAALGNSSDIYLWLAVVFATIAAFISAKLRKNEKENQ